MMADIALRIEALQLELEHEPGSPESEFDMYHEYETLTLELARQALSSAAMHLDDDGQKLAAQLAQLLEAAKPTRRAKPGIVEDVGEWHCPDALD